MKTIFCNFFFAVLSFFCAFHSNGQILLNEICSSNSTVIANDNGDYDDWIEIYNAGSSAVNLNGYGLSDDTANLRKFIFPDYSLGANSRIIVFCSDKNQTEIVDHWETPVSSTNTWKYFVGTSNPDTNWRNNSFNDATWLSGVGGIGFGDGDDNTTIATCNAVMVRKHFTISDTANILKAIFNIDYDDGFVAFLNGVEIARANVGMTGDRPAYNVVANNSHEAVMYQGMNPEEYILDPAVFKSILRIGDNVLAIQVHNTNPSNPDLSCIPFLSFGIRNGVHTWPNPPSWFSAQSPEHFQAHFKLSRTGETVDLTNALSVIVDQHTFTGLDLDNSKGRIPDGSVNWCYFKYPTPGLTNNSSTCYTGYATIPLFSLQAGFYTGLHWLTLTTTQPAGVIRYSLDGSDPKDTSPVYTAPILLNATKIIRAKVFAPGYLPSTTISNSYFVNENIHLPVFTISTDPYNLYDSLYGIYALGPNADTAYPHFGANYWQDWERPAAIEFYDKSKNRLFKFTGDISIAGNYSQAAEQKSFEIKLGDKYGTGSIQYSFFPDKPYVNNTDDIVLRNAGTDNCQMHYRDHLMEKVLKGTHADFIAQDPVVLFLNGEFWGMYQVVENDNKNFVQTNYGYKSNEIDFLKESGNIETTCGSDTGFFNMLNYSATANQSTAAFYNAMNGMFDLENMTDYYAAETYYCNEDFIGPWTNNIVLWRPSSPIGKWKYITKDLDFGLGLSSRFEDNMLDTILHPTAACYNAQLLSNMLLNPTFKRYFINRYADLINTTFLPSNMLPVLTAIHDSMAFDMPQHFAKWGMTQLVWDREINKATDFINQRPAYARDYIQSEFSMTSQVTLTLNASPAGAGRIQISTVTPTTLPWSGVYFNGNPVTITAIPNPGYTFDHWLSNVVIGANDYNQSTTYNFTSADQITAYFTGSPATPLITFSEINYNCDSIIHSDDWIELHNYGATSVDISGWKFMDEQDNHVFEFPVNTVIAAGGYLVVAEDLAKFSTAYPSVSNVIGSTGFSFANTEELLHLYDYRDTLYKSVFYSDQLPWPEAADGKGYTCELIDPNGDLNDGNNWFAGCLHGSPGRAYSTITASIGNSGSLSFCSPGSVSLSSNTGTGYAYQWLLNASELPGQTNSQYTAVSSGWYAVMLDSSGCRATDSVLVSAITISDPLVTAGSNCGPGAVTVSATGGGAIVWYDIPNGNIIGNGNTFTTPYLTSSVTYYAVSDSGGCQSSFIPVTASINEITAAPVTADVTRCGPGTVTMNATDTATVHWYDSLTGGSLLQTGPTFTTPVLNSTTTYYVEAGTNCPSSRVAVNAIINVANPPVTTDGNRCGPGTINLSATATDPVSWYDQPSGGNFLGTTYSFTTPVISTTTTYYAEANNGCASVRVPAIATINSVTLPPQVVSSFSCGTGDVTLTASSADPISWYDAPVAGNLLGTGSTLTLTGISITTIVYALAGTLCPSIRIRDTAFVYTQPVINLGTDIILTSPQTATLDAGAGFVSYLWSTGETTQTIIVNSTNTYSVTAIDGNGCSATDDIMVTVYVGLSSIQSNGINIYPNPVHDILTIQLPTSMSGESKLLKMFDVTGRVVFTESLSGSGLHTIDVSAFAKGVYVITLDSNSQRRVVQVIVN
ncbi:MAG: CotH kinase family protein [Bacteroidetes bacterium]|nr:CotH kinase family protein [Bacteroidota bacterium]